jgi:hypothetical protein
MGSREWGYGFAKVKGVKIGENMKGKRDVCRVYSLSPLPLSLFPTRRVLPYALFYS